MIREDLSTYKMVIFDFDDTLFIHSRHLLGKTIEEQMTYDCDMITGNVDNESQPGESSELMKVFIDACTNAGCNIGLCSMALSFQHMKSKEKWVKKNYGINYLFNCCVGDSKHKERILRTISNAYDLHRDEILFVDDNWETLTIVLEHGFHTASPMEVANFVLKHYKKLTDL